MERIDETRFGGLADLLETQYTVPGAMYAHLDSYRFRAPKDHDASKPLVKHVLCFIVVVHGTIDINIDHRMHHCTSAENNLVEFRATNAIYEMYISADFRGCVFALTRSFMINNMGFMGFGGNAGAFFFDNPVFNISLQDRQVVLDAFARVERNMMRENHRFFNETIYLSVIEAFLELVNIVLDKGRARTDNELGRSARREELCHNFMNMLIEYGKSEHSVSFYADKLCITPQYLTKVLKKEFNFSANRMIDINLISEATKLLRNPTLSIGEIVDELNFSDQASFSKFFRKNTGTSPARFRRSHTQGDS